MSAVRVGSLCYTGGLNFTFYVCIVGDIFHDITYFRAQNRL